MHRLFGLIRTLGWKHFLWKVWLLGKKKAGVESWFSKSIPYDQPQRDGISAGGYLNIIAGDGHWSEQQREHITGTLRSLNLPAGHFGSLVNDILNNRISYFSHEPIALSGLDFNYNPIEDIHVPAGKHSSRYFSFDPAIGDLKKVWELNRFHWANPLVTAYILEGSEDLRKEIRDYYENALVTWLAQCPHERSVAWACSQEISIRCLNWLWAVWLLEIKNEKVLSPLLNAIHLSAAHVFRQIDFARAQRNNHAITESAFLLFFARFFPQQPEAAKYRSKGEEVLTECLEDQFFDDGGYIQNSHTYHRFALQSLCVAFPLVENTGLKALLSKKMAASYRFLQAHVANEAGDFPNLGPNDGAMLYNFGGSSYRDLRPLLNGLSMILEGKISYDDPVSMVDMIIHQLVRDLDSPMKLPKKSMDITPRDIFPMSGQVILQDQVFKVFFRCADLTGRFPSSSDQLHVDIWYKGKNVLTDTGSWEYYNSLHPEHFTLLLTTMAHNTVRVAGKDQMEKGPRFTFLSRANGKLSYTAEDISGITGEHDGFRHRILPETVHSRKVTLHDGTIIIEDTITEASGDVELFWHLAEEAIDWSGDRQLVLKDSGLRMDFSSENAFSLHREVFPRSLYYASATYAPMARVILPAVTGTVKFETRISLLSAAK